MKVACVVLLISLPSSWFFYRANKGIVRDLWRRTLVPIKIYENILFPFVSPVINMNIY